MSYKPPPGAPGYVAPAPGSADVQRFVPSGSYGTIAASSLASGVRTGTGQNATTGSTATVTAAANAVLICAVQSPGASAIAITAVTGLGLTWNKLADQPSGTSVFGRITLFWAVTTTAPTPGVLTITNPAGPDTDEVAYSVTQITGANTAAPFPQAAGSAVYALTPTATLAGPVHTSSRPIAFVHGRATITPRTNWTELSEVVATSSYFMEVQYRSGAWEALALATVGTTSNTAMIALEIAAAPPTTVYTWTKPTTASMVSILTVHAGGGAGPGQATAGSSSADRYGGGGGASGALSVRILPAAMLAATEQVVVGLGGPGNSGASNTTGTPTVLAGKPGRNGGATYFRSPKFTGLTPAGGGLPGLSPAVYSTAGAVNTAAFADGIGPYAKFSSARGIVVDSAGVYAYIADYGNNRIRRIHLPTGIVTTLAGSGTAASVDGTGTAAQFSNPGPLCFDPTETYLYVVDVGSGAVRRVTIATGVVVSFTMSMGGGFSFTSTPMGIVCGLDGATLYVSQQNANQVFKVAIAYPYDSVVTVFAGSGTAASLDGTGAAAQFNAPRGMVLDASGTYLYVVDYSGHKVRRITMATAVVTTIAGTGTGSSTDNATGTSATFSGPASIALDPTGSYLYVVDMLSNKLRKVLLSGTGTVSTLAAPANGNAADGTLGSGVFAALGYGIAADPSDNYVHYTDQNGPVRRIYTREAAAPSQALPAVAAVPGSVSVIPGVPGGAVNTASLSAANAGQASEWGATGGGQGGSAPVGTTDYPGGAGGARGATPGVAGGTTPGGAGTAGTVPATDQPGMGGGGGATAGAAGNAGSGGAGSSPGGGGGGGGAVYGTTRTSGDGAPGGNGLIVVTSW